MKKQIMTMMCVALPIVMLTTESNPTLKEKGKALGVKAWLLKPFNKDKFLLVLKKLLG